MGSHHAGPEYPGDQYPQDDQRYQQPRQGGRERREQDPGSPYGRRDAGAPPPPPSRGDSGRGGYGGAPVNPYTQQSGGGYREEPTGRHATQPGGGYQPPQPSGPPEPPAGGGEPRRRRRYAEEEQGAAPVWPEQAQPPAPERAPRPEPSAMTQAFQSVSPGRDPYHPDLADHSAQWEDDQSTKVFSHLGYVPRPERPRRLEPHYEEYAPSPETEPGDDKRFKSMRRARKASGTTRILMIVGVVLVVALVAGGAYWMFKPGDDGRSDAGGTYPVLAKPCSALDTAAIADYQPTEDQTRHRESSEPKSDGGAEQVCAVAMNGGNEIAVDIQFESRVYDSDAKARNDWEFKLDGQKTKPAAGWKLVELSGVGTQAFALLQSWDGNADAANYKLSLWDGNVSIDAGLTIYSTGQVADEDIAARMDKLVKAYLAKWKG